MAGVSIDDFGASFIHYLPGYIMTLNNTTKARLLPKGKLTWEGVHLEKKVHVRRNPSITFTEDGGPIPAAGKQGYTTAKAYRRFLVGSVKVSEGLLTNAKTTKNAAINVVDSELRGMMESIRKQENFWFGRDGTGVVALLGTTVSGSTLTVSDARLMWEDADFTVLDTDGSTEHGSFVVSSIARAATYNASGIAYATVTPSASFTGSGSQAAGDYIVWGSGSKMMYNRAPTGLDALVDDNTGTFQAVNVTTYNRYTSLVLSNGGVARPMSTSLLRQLNTGIRSEAGEDIDSSYTFLTNKWQGNNFEEMFEGEVRLTESTKVGGIEVSRFQSVSGSYDVVTDDDMPYNKAFFVDMAEITRAEQAQLDWRRAGDGPSGIFQIQQNSLNRVATCMETYEYMIDKRNRGGKIEDLVETKSTMLG
jgi:hypothetical protein